MNKELAPGKNEARLIEIDGESVVEMQLSRGYTTLVDLADWDRIRRFRWFAHGREPWVYAAAWDHLGGGWRNRRMILLHRVVLDDPEAPMVDHREQRTLDNRKAQLRRADNSTNQANRVSRVGSSRHKGVSWVKEKGRWRASIHRHGCYIFLGYFASEADAAQAYDAAAGMTDGEFARLNAPRRAA